MNEAQKRKMKRGEMFQTNKDLIEFLERRRMCLLNFYLALLQLPLFRLRM